MKDLQKQIEELKEVAESHVDFSDWDQGKSYAAKEALSIIEQLQEENSAYILCLRKINSCDDSATQQSKEAHQVLKQFGKL
jgi:hypothetical protein